MSTSAFMPNEAVVATIQQDLAAYNAQRVGAAKSVSWRLWIFHGLFTAVMAVIVLAVASLSDDGLFSAAGWFVVAIGVGGYLGAHALALSPGRQLQQAFRDRLIPTIFSFLEQVNYRHGAPPNSFEYLPKEAIGTYNRHSFDDCLFGRHEGMGFEAFEARFAHKVGKGSEQEVFRGVVLAFQLEKPFPARLIARTRTSVSGFTRFIQGLFGSGGLEEVKTGDGRVDTAYEFRSDNPIRARQLVSPDFTHALDELGTAWPHAPSRIAIARETGFVLLPTQKNFFELPQIGIDCDYKRHIEPMVHDLMLLLDIARLVRSAAR